MRFDIVFKVNFMNRLSTSKDCMFQTDKDSNLNKKDLEYDLRSTEWILNKVRSSEDYARLLYSALCNNQFLNREMWEIIKNEPWSCSWRYAGGIIADMREEGDYMDWYCRGNEGLVDEVVKDDLYELGWTVVTNNEN